MSVIQPDVANAVQVLGEVFTTPQNHGYLVELLGLIFRDDLGTQLQAALGHLNYANSALSNGISESDPQTYFDSEAFFSVVS